MLMDFDQKDLSNLNQCFLMVHLQLIFKNIYIFDLSLN